MYDELITEYKIGKKTKSIAYNGLTLDDLAKDILDNMQ